MAQIDETPPEVIALNYIADSLSGVYEKTQRGDDVSVAGALVLIAKSLDKIGRALEFASDDEGCIHIVVHTK